MTAWDPCSQHQQLPFLQVTAKALKAGKHVLQEKPIGGSLDDVLVTLNTYYRQGADQHT